ncbi:proto-oncogene DBL [Vombatus ursinus]|uniref:proto-oncogene DBL n=1 Tax=Vombatus ursinus TaxID=29139 RepID=UPI000FFCF331|nr:proto-oncogene DBL [Vombatus ursinus]
MGKLRPSPSLPPPWYPCGSEVPERGHRADFVLPFGQHWLAGRGLELSAPGPQGKQQQPCGRGALGSLEEGSSQGPAISAQSSSSCGVSPKLRSSFPGRAVAEGGGPLRGDPSLAGLDPHTREASPPTPPTPLGRGGARGGASLLPAPSVACRLLLPVGSLLAAREPRPSSRQPLAGGSRSRRRLWQWQRHWHWQRQRHSRRLRRGGGGGSGGGCGPGGRTDGRAERGASTAGQPKQAATLAAVQADMALTLTPENMKISEVEMECYYCLLQAAALIESIIASKGALASAPLSPNTPKLPFSFGPPYPSVQQRSVFCLSPAVRPVQRHWQSKPPPPPPPQCLGLKWVSAAGSESGNLLRRTHFIGFPCSGTTREREHVGDTATPLRSKKLHIASGIPAPQICRAGETQTTIPICAKDITDLLVKELAFLSGGRGKDNDWIITFPENSNFKDVPEDVLTKVLTYLTSLPRQHEPDTKFILILDRRLDTWASVKITLQRIAASFPGNLHLVMVLRPTSFIQRTFTDIGFRFSQDDFILKLPVVMLSSVSDLLSYIDEKQLTPEFGGTLEYCHSEWVIFRTAIESFALTVKEMAQILQSFGTELAETELPDDAFSIEQLLTIRTAKYFQLKEEIISVMKEGNMLLRTFEVPNTKESNEEPPQEKPGDWETVNRLLAQLHEMEVAFDEFWDKHQLKMNQYIQLSKFEQNFLELKDAIEFLMDQHAAIPSTGDSVVDVKQRLTELGTLDEMATELIGKAQLLILHGHQLAANHHYAVDLICQRCNELRHQTDVLSEELKAKENTLTKTLELQSRLHQALLCCDEGAYLLANQPMDKCQAKEGAQRALYDIEKFLDVTLPNLKYDPRVLQREFEVILTPELKAQIQGVQVKLENIRSMFQNRQACFRKLTDKHSRPIQLVTPRPEHAGRSKSPLFSPKHVGFFFSNCRLFSSVRKSWSRKTQNSLKIEVMHDYEEKRNSLQHAISENEDSLNVLKSHVINELIETERVYVDELSTVLVGYRAEMDNPGMLALIPPALKNRKDILFGNMPEIYEFHNKIFLHSLESCLEAPQRVGFCFLERRSDFQIYEKYCQNKPRSELLWRQCSESAFFLECQKKLEHKLGLDSYLLKPVQRLTKYQLLLKELLKYSASSEGVQQLQEALVAMLDLLKSVNDSMHQTAITGYDGNLSDLGRVLMQGSFSVWISHRKGTTKMKDFARFKPMQRHLFLYEKAIVFCKRRDEHGDGHERTPFYSFKHYLKMSAIGITENVKGDNRKFEIWYTGREEVYIVQAQTVESKAAWLTEIRKILIKQQELIKVEKRKKKDYTGNCSQHACSHPDG